MRNQKEKLSCPVTIPEFNRKKKDSSSYLARTQPMKRHGFFVYFLGSSADREASCNAGDLDSIPGLRRSPGEGNGYPLQYPCLENGQRRLAGYNPWGHKESDMMSTSTYVVGR